MPTPDRHQQLHRRVTVGVLLQLFFDPRYPRVQALNLDRQLQAKLGHGCSSSDSSHASRFFDHNHQPEQVVSRSTGDLVLGPHTVEARAGGRRSAIAAHVHVGRAPVEPCSRAGAYQLLRIHAIVLAFGTVDQPQLPRMRHRHVMRQRPELLVQMPIAAGGLVADRERFLQLSQTIDHGGAWSFELNLFDGSAAGVENAQRRLTRVNIEPT
jgi:hypothetical protein